MPVRPPLRQLVPPHLRVAPALRLAPLALLPHALAALVVFHHAAHLLTEAVAAISVALPDLHA